MANAYKWRQNFIKEFEKVKKEFVRREVYGRKEQIWNAYYKHLLKIEIETGEDGGILGRADRYNRKKKLPGILKFIANHIMSVQLGFRNRDTPGLRGRMGGLKAAAVYHGFGDWVSLFPGVQGEPFREHDKPLVAISRFGMRTWSKYDTWEEVKPVWRNTAAHELGHAKDHAFGILFDKARSRFTQITHFLNPDKAPEDFYSERAHVSKMLKRCFKVKKDAADWHHRSVELYADLTSLRVLLQRPINKWDFILAKEAGRYGGIRQIYRGEMKTQDGEKMLKIWRMWAINTPPVAAAIREKFPTTPFVGPDAPTLHGSLRLGPAERLAMRRREQSPRYQAFVKQQREKNLEKLEGFLSKKQERHYMSTGRLPGGIICKLSPESPYCKTWQRRQSTRGGRDSRGPAGHGNPFLDPGDPRNIDPRNIDESLKENKRKKSIKDIARSLADDTHIDWLEVWYSMYDSGISDKYLDPMLASHIWEVFDYKKCRPWQGAHALERLAQVKKSRIAENFNNNKLFITNDPGRTHKMKITKSALKQIIKEELEKVQELRASAMKSVMRGVSPKVSEDWIQQMENDIRVNSEDIQEIFRVLKRAKLYDM
tara:strand:- start:10731 stop:12524 length:1794 start_codon:yes stop_codon:yes gene_type:complete